MRRALILVVASLLAGCAEQGASLAPPTASAAVLPWGLSSCVYVIASVPVDDARLAARLPPAFRLAPSALAPLPAGPRAELALDAYVCERGVGHAGALADVAYGSHYVAVLPPDALREEGYDAYFVKWDPLIDDAPRLAALTAAGMRAHAGTARVALAPAPGGGLDVDAALAFVDGGGFTLRGAAGPADPQDAPLPFMEFTPLADGRLARWHARLHNATFATGSGIVELAPGSWAREVVGSDRAPATFIAGAWNLDEADVILPRAT